MTIKVTYNVTDVYMSQSVSPVYINVSYSDGGASGGGVWGTITGTLSNQTDLQTALNAKFDDPTGTTSQYLRGDGSLATFPALTDYVPYSGATGNVNLGEYELKAGQLTLDTTPTGTATVGTTRWNDTIGSSETTLKGGSVVLKNGVDLVARVVNKVTPNTTLTKAAYQAVRVSGAQGQRLAIALAQANNDTNSADTIGLVIETIPTNQEGFIMAVGQLEGINTTGSLQGETWVDGDVLYLSPTVAGAITNVKPTGAGHIVVIGYVEYAHVNNGKIYVKVMNGWELEELHDVDIVTPANNQGLFYESSTALWKNKSISTVLGYTPEQPLTFSSPLSRSVNAVSIPQATGSVSGFLSSTDWTTFNSKQAALGFTPANAATTLTINGVTFDLSANRSWTVAAGIGGTIATGQVAFATAANTIGGSNNLFWDNTNGRLGIGTNTPSTPIDILYNNPSTSLGSLRVKNTNSAGINEAQFLNNNDQGGGFGTYGTTFGGVAFRNNFVVNATKSIIFLSDSLIGTGGTSTISFITGGYNVAAAMTLNGLGRLSIGTTSDLGVRLGVVGDTLLRGSGNTSATTALTVQNSDGTQLIRMQNQLLSGNQTGLQIGDGTNAKTTFITLVKGAPTIQTRYLDVITSADILYISGGLGVGNNNLASNHGSITLGDGNYTLTNPTQFNVVTSVTGNFVPTSGSASFIDLLIKPTINQTGGANGITRGLYVNPTLTAAADWRSIEWSNNTGWGLYGAGTANNYLGGNIAIGSTSNTSDWLNIAASTTAKAHIFLAAGVAPTSPANGDIWFDGTDIKMRIGGVTKTFTLI